MVGRTSAADIDALAYHGGALDVARRLVPDAPKPWIDLSTGINPHAYPLPDLPPDLWRRLPEGAALADLERVAAQRYRARLAPNGVVGTLGPTYRGHGEAFAAAGARVVEAASLEALSDCAVGVVVNPNNPDGRVAGRLDLLDLHARLAARGGLLVVDEAFADFDPEESLTAFLPERSAVVLRSFGK